MIEKDLIEIYKDNMFLLKAENKDLWFSVMSPGYFTLFFHPFHSQPSTFMSLKQASKIVS